MILALSKFPINVAPFGIVTPAEIANGVSNPAKVEAINNTNPITTVPTINARKIFPLHIAVNKHTIYGITAKSANGRIQFPGRIIANAIVIGTSTNPTAITAGSPSDTAASNPINTSRPANFLLINSCAA